MKDFSFGFCVIRVLGLCFVVFVVSFGVFMLSVSGLGIWDFEFEKVMCLL